MKSILFSSFFLSSTYSFCQKGYVIPKSDWIKEFNSSNVFKSLSYQIKTDESGNIYVASKKNAVDYSAIKRNATLIPNSRSKQANKKSQ